MYDDAPAVGPIDDGTVAPARGLSMAQAGALLLVCAVTLVFTVVLAPRVLAGLGLVGRTSATVIDAGEGAHPATGTAESDPQQSAGSSSGCDAVSRTVEWGDRDGRSHRGTLEWCTVDQAPAAGDVVSVWALPGWDPVRAGSRGAESILAIALLAVLAASAAGSVRYVRQWRSLVRAGRSATTSPMLAGRVDRLLIQRGVFKKDGRARLRIAFPDTDLQSLYLVVPQAVPRSMLGAAVTLRPLGRTLRGRRTGPYVVQRGDSASGTLVGLGRAYRSGRGNKRE